MTSIDTFPKNYELMKAIEEINLLQKELLEKAQTIEELRIKNQNLTLKNSELESHVKITTYQMSQLNSMLMDVNQKNRDLQEEQEVLKAQKNTLFNQLVDMEDENKAIKKSMELIKDASQNMQKMLEEELSQASKLKEEVNYLTEENKMLKKSMERMSIHINLLKQRYQESLKNENKTRIKPRKKNDENIKMTEIIVQKDVKPLSSPNLKDEIEKLSNKLSNQLNRVNLAISKSKNITSLNSSRQIVTEPDNDLVENIPAASASPNSDRSFILRHADKLTELQSKLSCPYEGTIDMVMKEIFCRQGSAE